MNAEERLIHAQRALAHLYECYEETDLYDPISDPHSPSPVMLHAQPKHAYTERTEEIANLLEHMGKEVANFLRTGRRIAARVKQSQAKARREQGYDRTDN